MQLLVDSGQFIRLSNITNNLLVMLVSRITATSSQFAQNLKTTLYRKMDHGVK